MSLANVSVSNASPTTIYAGGQARKVTISNLDAANFITIKYDASATVLDLTNGERIGPGAVWVWQSSQMGDNHIPLIKGLASTAAVSVSVQVIGGLT